MSSSFSRSIGRLVYAVLTLTAVCLLAACVPDAYRIDRARMESALAKRFPLERDLSGVVLLRLTEPRLTLMPEGQRLRVDADAELRRGAVGAALGALFGRAASAEVTPIRGVVAVSGRPAFDTATRTLILREPTIDRLDFPDAPGRLRAVLDAARGPLAMLFADAPLYRVDAAQDALLGGALDSLRIEIDGEGVTLRR